MVPPPLRLRVAQWFQRSINRRILAAALTVGGFSLVVKLTAMTKELVVAYRFGTGDVIDAFLIAFLLPSLIVNIVAGSFSAAFTPVYIDVRENRGRPDACRLLGSATAGSAVLVVGMTCILLVASPLALRVLAGGFGPDKLALTRELFLILLPIILLNAFITLWSAVLNAEGHFAWTSIAPLGVPLLTLGMLVFTARFWGVYSLALGTLLGYVIQCAILAVALRRAGLHVLPRWEGATPELKRVLRQYVPMVAGAVLTSSSWAIGQAMAATLPTGSVAALNYGNRIVAVITEIGSMAIATAVLPHFSLMVARREWPTIRRTLRVYARMIAVAVVPATLLGIYLSPTIVRILFMRGAFTTKDAQVVAGLQSLYLVNVPFVMVGMLFVRLASSLQKNQLLLLGAAITLPVNVALNAVLMHMLGVTGIALATSLAYIVSCIYLFLSVGRALDGIEHEHGLRHSLTDAQ